MFDEPLSTDVLMEEIFKLQQLNRELVNENEGYRKLCSQILDAHPKKYRDTLETLALLSDAFFTVDRDWRFTYINPKAEAAWHQSHQELIGKDLLGEVLWDVLPEYKTSPGYAEHIRAMDERIPVVIEMFVPNHSGWREINLYPMEDGGLSCYYKDINKRKQSALEIEAAQQNAIQSSNELQAVIDAVPAAIFIARDPEGKVIVGNEYINKIAAADFPPLSDSSLSVSESVWPDNLKIIFNGHEITFEEMPVHKAAAGEIIKDMELDFHLKDGSIRTMLGNAVPIFNNEGIATGSVGAFIDISERKQAENRLRCQNAVLDGINRIFEYALFSSSKKDLGRFCLQVAEEVTGSQYGFISELNSKRKMDNIATSLPAAEMSQVLPDLRDKVMDTGIEPKGIYHSVLSRGLPMFSNNPASHPDSIGIPAGHPPVDSFMGIPLKNKGQTIGMIGLANRKGGYTEELMKVIEPLANAIVQVLARQKDLEALDALQASDERYRSLTERLLKANLAQSEDRFYKTFHYNPDMMIIVNMKDYSIIEVNRTALDTFNFTREEIIGNTPTKLGILVVEKEILNIFQQDLLKYGKIKDIELNTYSKSGKKITLLLSAILIKFNEQECSLMIARDITDRKHYEKELARLDRLSLIGEMAASIGHEIRNPMTSVRGFLQMFNEQDEAGDKRLYYELMIEELDRANSIITEFLSMARNKTSNLQPLFLNSLIKSIQPIIQAEAILKGNEVKVLLEGSPPLMLDKNEIRQMILNMVRNALEAMPGGGQVTITTQVTEKETMLLIKDQGPGIDPEYLERIGTPFVSSKENGTGLGLAVCYSIAARHGAKIDFETGSEGTTFKVHFPKVLKAKLIS